MSKKSLLIVTMLMTMGATGRLWAQSQALTMSLEQLFQTADLHNTSIKSFDAAIREAEAGIKAAKAERLPDVDASVAFSYLGGGCIMDRDFSNGVGVHIPHYGNNFALTASMPIYAGGAITSGINLSRLRPLYMKRKTLNKVKKSRGKHRFLGNKWYLCGKFTKTARK